MRRAGVRIGKGGGYISPIMVLDLTEDEKLALVAHLRHALEYDPHPFAPRLEPLKAILAKLEPPAAQGTCASSRSLPEPLARLQPGMRPRVGRGRFR